MAAGNANMPAAGSLEDRSGRISAFNDRAIGNMPVGGPAEVTPTSQAPNAVALSFLPEQPFQSGLDPQSGVIARSMSLPLLPRKPSLALRYVCLILAKPSPGA